MKRTVGCLIAGLLFVLAGTPRIARSTPASQPSPRDERGMEYIRLVFRRPGVQTALRERGYSKGDIRRRLAALDRSLTVDQERRLARRLRQQRASGADPGSLESSGGNAFLGTTLDLVTEILLIPIKIVSWIIPGI